MAHRAASLFLGRIHGDGLCRRKAGWRLGATDVVRPVVLRSRRSCAACGRSAANPFALVAGEAEGGKTK